MMERKGILLLISSLLLIILATVLAFVIYERSRDVVSLSPEVDCLGVDFRADIVRDGGNFYLDVENYGNLNIDGFFVKLSRGGEFDLFEDVDLFLPSRDEKKLLLSRNYLPGRYLVVPKVEGSDSNDQLFIGVCKDLYGYETFI